MRSPKGHDVDERVILEKVVKSYVDCGYTYFQTYFQIVRINYKNVVYG